MSRMTCSLPRPCLLLAMLLIGISGASGAAGTQTMTATRRGLMCESPSALSRLTLPDGSDRADDPKASDADKQVLRDGHCLDFGPGLQVAVTAIRRNTILLGFDPEGGNNPRSFIAPSIDFTGSAANGRSGRNPCLHSDDLVTVSGTIHWETLPPDPDFDRSRPWSYQAIRFDHPICVLDADFGDVPQGRIASVIFLDQDHAGQWGEGDPVRLTGTLGPPDNGNQPPDPLMLVIK